MLSLLSTAGTLAGIAVGNLSTAMTWRMMRAIDVVFLAAMTLMVLAGFLVVYTLL